jgi:hypothetical protein
MGLFLLYIRYLRLYNGIYDYTTVSTIIQRYLRLYNGIDKSIIQRYLRLYNGIDKSIIHFEKDTRGPWFDCMCIWMVICMQ